MTRTFVSYDTEYDRHWGSIPMVKLPRERQDELIRLMFEPSGDSQSYVTQYDIEHAQPDGLWTLIVAIGMALEKAGVIRDFTTRTDADRDWIINFLAGTNLWLRLEEAFPPFADYHPKTDYDWDELETFSAPDAIAELDDSDTLKSDLTAFLSKPSHPKDGHYTRMPYQDFHREYEAGKLSAFVDRGMAVQAFQLSPGAWKSVLPPVFLLGLIAFVPVTIFVSVWAGIALLMAAIAAKKLLNAKAVDWVRRDALGSRSRYRWYAARNIVWGRKV